MSVRTLSGARLVATVCAAQVLVQIGAFFWPALLPGMMTRWALTNSEAGWITAIFYGAYLLAVPVLVTLTDRVDAKRVYLFGVGCTVLSHLLFGLYADCFVPAMVTRARMGFALASCVLTLWMRARRGWPVAFLAFVAIGAEGALLSPAVVVTGLGLVGAVASVIGNEPAIRFGRRRLICCAMAACVL